ncbi:protein-L-isoaspartate(D-aspartate) O-methyltransferase [Geminocystis sp. NIES-3708]|uniref:protein-L-isoaspartate(D-aspartate) O-methyltransferase n=1 Tax=Geminocystis sp. NIES-3708 TaxID=1615909 RepID=UPI00082F7E28|nr:protein-L-isoaspartate(D-aspartate) O-methyltransferase [Geminocystis sp. NIES-3708]
MVKKQLEPRGIIDSRVLKAMLTVPRHLFLESDVAPFAYEDCPLPIANNQTISQPYIVAYMTELATISPKAKVLEIGTGSGYQAAILGLLAKEVYTIEFFPELARKASNLLQQLGYNNIQIKAGDGYQGWSEHAPYDAILVTAAPDHIPQPLIDQLAINGKMIIPVGNWSQSLILLTKTPHGIVENRMLPVCFVPLIRKLV